MTTNIAGIECKYLGSNQRQKKYEVIAFSSVQFLSKKIIK